MSTKNFPPQIRYTYVQNDPVNFVDLWGLCKGDKKLVTNNIYAKAGIILYEGMPLIQTSSINTTTIVKDGEVSTFVSAFYPGNSLVTNYRYLGNATLIEDGERKESLPLTYPKDNTVSNGDFVTVGEAVFSTKVNTTSSLEIEYDIDLLITQPEGIIPIEYSKEKVTIR